MVDWYLDASRASVFPALSLPTTSTLGAAEPRTRQTLIRSDELGPAPILAWRRPGRRQWTCTSTVGIGKPVPPAAQHRPAQLRPVQSNDLPGSSVGPVHSERRTGVSVFSGQYMSGRMKQNEAVMSPVSRSAPRTAQGTFSLWVTPGSASAHRDGRRSGSNHCISVLARYSEAPQLRTKESLL